MSLPRGRKPIKGDTRAIRATKYRAASREIITLVRDTLENGFNSPIEIGPAAIGELNTFRKQLYGWRYSVLTQLSNPDAPGTAEGLEWLNKAMGPRANPEWFQLLKFTVEIRIDGAYLVSQVRKPLYGGNPSETAEILPIVRTLVDQAVRSGRTSLRPRKAMQVVDNQEQIIALAQKLVVDPREIEHRAAPMIADGLDWSIIEQAITNEIGQ